MKRRRILVIDDDPVVNAMLKDVLEEEGYDVADASNGREGLDSVAREMPDLILLDMRMPIMSGWEFAHEFHARYDHTVPIIVVSAAADAPSMATEVGANGWVGKPFDLIQLAEVVDASFA